MTPTVVRDYTITMLAKEQHLRVPVVRAERPAVTEDYGLPRSPILVIDLRVVAGCDSRHVSLLFAVKVTQSLT
jgi:hypothetical protein